MELRIYMLKIVQQIQSSHCSFVYIGCTLLDGNEIIFNQQTDVRIYGPEVLVSLIYDSGLAGAAFADIQYLAYDRMLASLHGLPPPQC